jgi:diguanylate cyclase (GGDEF)-like protein
VVNDSLGRDAGDMMLQIVARRLQITAAEEFGAGALVGRIASDEFVIVCGDLPSADDAMKLAGRIHGVFMEPVSLGEDRIKARLSVGIALAGPATADADSLLRHAEAAAARAKAQGADRIETFDADMRELAQQRLRTEIDLAGACHRGEMRLHYQPIFHLAEQRVTGLEALVRWQHPERGLVPPDLFIPLAEETGLIRQIGEWVMEEGFRQCALWNRAGAEVHVGVNISARQINQDGFVDSVGALLDRIGPGVGPHMEITESVLMADPEDSAAKLHELRDMGVRLSLDDFGTGYSSLAYLQRFPVHILKIDRSFVSGIDGDSRQRALVQAMVQLGHALDLLVLGEGVETPAERTVLEDLGVDLLQGFLLCRPLPAAELPVPGFLPL